MLCFGLEGFTAINVGLCMNSLNFVNAANDMSCN